MKFLYDFHCQHCGEDSERFVDSECREVRCKCGETTDRVIATPTVSLEGITGAFPGAHSKWASIREDNARIKARKSEH